ncbi:PAS domain-containing protein [Sphingomonas sp. ID1715]|uniref:PAS domain-containing protein n=1 Tax=Sphingomonas sp. ID1715 TaxID=1656898 RepID=UPI001487F34D|nr:PAS domain-containing protein [Sphingomonas sp. ID1715]NNM75971.1 PAS domain-containing protein [Sphingomonas sp. ID1715]
MDATYGSDFRDAHDELLTAEDLGADSGGRERRMHVRAYDYWMSLRRGRPCPSIHELEPDRIADFGPNSVLLDFSRSVTNPSVTFIGRALREECGILYGIRSVADVPEGSLLSRLTQECGRVLERKTPISFENDVLNRQGEPVSFRGVLMPLSSDGQAIDFVYGVINWKAGASAVIQAPPEAVVEQQPEPAPAEGELIDWLARARARVERALKAANDARSALHAALGLAYAFALLAETRAGEFIDLLAKAGLKHQPRTPMTSVVKLVFGASIERARLSQYAAVLSHARHLDLGCDDLPAWLDGVEGGINGVVKAERARRAPAVKPDPAARARALLRDASPEASIDYDGCEDEFVLLVARRLAQGRFGILRALTEQALVNRALRASAR